MKFKDYTVFVMFQGLGRIAAISVMIGHKTLATDLLSAALKRKKSEDETEPNTKTNTKK